MGSQLYDEIVSQRGSLERLVAKIPGFRGYQEKQARREADTLLRNQLAEDIERLVSRFNRLEVKLVDKSGLAGMGKTREIKTKMQSYADRVRTAAPKYSAMFASVKINEQELDRIYAFDEAQFRFVDKLTNKIDKLEDALKSDEDHSDVLEEVFEAAQEAIDAFDLRDDVILNISGSL